MIKELISLLTKNLRIPVIASGGAGPYDDLFFAVSNAGASAVAASSIFQFTESTSMMLKNYLSSKGIPVRMNYSDENLKFFFF